MKWAILTPTMATRRTFLMRLADCLGPQMVPEVRWNICELENFESLGAKRDHLKESTDAEYISFIDDDDLVAPDYVSRILPLLDGVDYVGFRLQASEDGIDLEKPTFHSLLCGGWFESKYAYHRDISLLNPMRRELSIQVPTRYDFGEDSHWANEMRSMGIVKTEHFIEETMYYYLSRPNKTDGVKPGNRTAGTCPKCRSPQTVWVGLGRFCNMCGGSFD